MGAMDSVSRELRRVLRAKEKRRKDLAALPFAEKVRIVVDLQRMAWPLVKDRDPRACVWDIAPQGDRAGTSTRD